jgi:glycine/D-amino acid oxidase-like deaminating enzyme
VQPARLALGLRERLRARGVAIFESSRVRSLRMGGPQAPAVAATDTGTVRAGAAVVAAGAATAGLGPMRGRLTVGSSHMVVTEPVPDVLEALGWTGGEAISDERTLLHYTRTTPDGRIAFGWAGGRMGCGARLGGKVQVDPDVAAQTAARLVRFFPGLAGRRIAHAWGGPIDVAPEHLPVVGGLGGGPAYVAAGYTGNGVGPSHLCGRILASVALDRRDEASRLCLVDPPRGARVPPEPLRWMGGALIRRALVRADVAADAGRRADPLTRFAATLPERMGVHLVR